MAIDIGRIHEALVAAGLPVAGVGLGIDNEVTVQWLDGVTPTPEQLALAASIIADPLNQARQPRTIRAIFADVNALTNAQKTAVWANLNAGTPQKFFDDTGENDGSIAVLFWAITFTGLPTAAIQAAQMMLVAMYCQDRPGYLRKPAFAPTINISGDEAAPGFRAPLVPVVPNKKG